MRFGPTPVEELVGAVLAHTLHLDGGPLVKGRRLNADDVRRLIEAGITQVTAARLEAGDLHEDAAAGRIASCVSGPNLGVGSIATGRANVFADADGLLEVDTRRLTRLNNTEESLTLATLTTGTRVRAGDLVATAKVIPLAVPGAAVDRWEEMAAGEPVLRVAPFRRKAVGLVLTHWDRTPDRVLERAEATLRSRIEGCGSDLESVSIVKHDADAVAGALGAFQRSGLSLLLALGASQSTDRADAIPAAVGLLGGTVHRFGIPVDPGNLLLWADIGGTPMLGVPGCARSPKRSGFDTVLERLLANLPMDGEFLGSLGHGGLLKEVKDRGRPRVDHPWIRPPRGRPRVAGILLAAGSSTRMGARNKLLEVVDAEPMVRRAARVLVEAGLDPVVVVTGHENAAVAAALEDLPVSVVINQVHEDGMSTSVVVGLDAVSRAETEGSPAVDGAVIALADMPWVRVQDVQAITEAFGPVGRSGVCVPVVERKRGNPVLWGSDHFPSLRALTGDEGARSRLAEVAERIVEVSIEHSGVLRDVDTPEALSEAQEEAPR